MKDAEGEYIRCRVTGKVCYTQKEAAGVIAVSRGGHRSRHYYNRGNHIPKRMYFCRYCQRYHLTSRKKPKKCYKDINSFSENY